MAADPSGSAFGIAAILGAVAALLTALGGVVAGVLKAIGDYQQRRWEYTHGVRDRGPDEPAKDE